MVRLASSKGLLAALSGWLRGRSPPGGGRCPSSVTATRWGSWGRGWADSRGQAQRWHEPPCWLRAGPPACAPAPEAQSVPRFSLTAVKTLVTDCFLPRRCGAANQKAGAFGEWHFAQSGFRVVFPVVQACWKCPPGSAGLGASFPCSILKGLRTDRCHRHSPRPPGARDFLLPRRGSRTVSVAV